MNYIKLINAFWQIKRERDDFDPYVISLFFALTGVANSQNWKSFSLYREDITIIASMSPSAYYKARKVLKEAGLINYVEGANKLSKCSFTVLPVYAINTVDDTVGDTQQEQLPIQNKDGKDATSNTVDDAILNKPLNLETLNLETLNKGVTTPSPKDGFEFLENAKSEAGNASLTAKEKKASHTGCAAPKEKAQLHLFKDSPYFDLEAFKSRFTGPEYESVNLDYYYRAVLNWSDSGRNKKVDWIATARGFMNRDEKEGKLATSKVIPINQQSHMGSRLDLVKKVSNMIQYDENGMMI